MVCTAYGPPEVLQLAELPRPEPRRGQVRIRIVWEAAGGPEHAFRDVHAGTDHADLDRAARKFQHHAVGKIAQRTLGRAAGIAGGAHAFTSSAARLPIAGRIWIRSIVSSVCQLRL